MIISIGSSLDSFLNGGLRDTLAEMGRDAWLSRLPSLVITPDSAVANAIRADLSASGIGLLGLEFARPEDLRSILASALADSSGHPVSERADLIAVMRQAALKLHSECPENRTFASMAISPDFLLDTVLLLASGGWTPASIPSQDLRKVAETFVALADDLGVQLAPFFDLKAQSSAQRIGPVFHGLALVGFDASSWNLWGLLSASALSAQNASVWLPDWSIKAEDAEMLWFSSWEAFGGVEIYPLDGAESPLEDFAVSYEASLDLATESTQGAPVELRVEADYGQLCKAVAGEVLSNVAAGKRRICVAVPAESFIGRNVSKILCDLEIDHFFSDGNRSKGVGESGAWNFLLRFLETQELTFLKGFFQSIPTLPKNLRSAGVNSTRISRSLERLRDDALTDSASMIMKRTRASEGKPEKILVDFIAYLAEFPKSVSFAEFGRALREICLYLGWNERASMVLDRINGCPFVDAEFDRSVFLSWISDTPSGRDRSEFSGKPYAPIQIVSIDGAHLVKWDHVIVVGANEGVFPKTPEYPSYISVHDLKSLNERIQKLNVDAVTGQEDSRHVIPGHALCLPPHQERMMQGRNFSRLVRNSSSLTIYAVARDETDGGREMFPSEVFSVCYGLKNGQILSQDLFQELSGGSTLFDYARIAKHPHSRIAEFEAAKSARAGNETFTDYEFSVNRLDHGVCIPASRWSMLKSCPEIVFLRYFLGVELSEENDEFQWLRAVGVWTHRIVAEAIGAGWVPLPEGNEWSSRILTSADRLKSDFRVLAEASEMGSPGWLDHLLAQSISGALGVARSLGSADFRARGYTHVHSEFPVDSTWDSPHGPIRCFGSIDLLLSSNPDGFTSAKVGVLDVKTGSDKKMTRDSVSKGFALQLVSYAFGLESLGAAEVEMGIVLPGVEVEPDLVLSELKEDLSDLSGLGGFIRRLAFGDFGHNGTSRDAFSFQARLPLATIPMREKRNAIFRSLNAEVVSTSK